MKKKKKKNTNRNYRDEYDNYHKKPGQRKNNNARHRARYAFGLKDLRVVSRKTNRRKGARTA